MKKTLTIFTFTVILMLIMTSAAFAQPGKGNPKGEVIDVDEPGGTITILTKDNIELVITVPKGFAVSSVVKGMVILAKGEWTDDGFDAEWVRVVGPDDMEELESEENGNGNGWGEGGVYCNDGKEEPHPVAAKIAEKYEEFGVDPEWIMSYACDGHGFGSVMLALQTQQAGGPDAEELLGERKKGKRWGQIWKGLGLIGKGGPEGPPPGLFSNPGKGLGPPPGKGPNKDVGPGLNNNDMGP